MTPDAFRRLALALPSAVENDHLGHPDFRVGKRVFATLGYPDTCFAMVKLTADQQAVLTAAEPAIFSPVKGGWGRRGATLVSLAAADSTTAESALRLAWANLQTKRR